MLWVTAVLATVSSWLEVAMVFEIVASWLGVESLARGRPGGLLAVLRRGSDGW